MLAVQIGIFNHVSYLDAFVVVWAFCVAGVTFHFSQTLPVLGYGVRALQNLYLPPENDKAKQQSSMVQLIKERYAQQNSKGRAGVLGPQGGLGQTCTGTRGPAAAVCTGSSCGNVKVVQRNGLAHVRLAWQGSRAWTSGCAACLVAYSHLPIATRVPPTLAAGPPTPPCPCCQWPQKVP